MPTRDDRQSSDLSSETGLDEPVDDQEVTPAFDADRRGLLEYARSSLAAAGFYAYLMIDEQQRWCVAADDEAGRVDVRVDDGRYVVEVCGSSPGLFMEEESEWRRQALERLARRVVPNVARGMLAENQSARWSDDEHGVTVCIAHDVPLDRQGDIAAAARHSLLELDDLLTLVESQLRS